MIDGVMIRHLSVFSDKRGKVMHMLRQDADFFEQFGEVYFSVVNKGVIKGWKKHLEMTQHFAVPAGNIKLVLYDDRDDSSTKGEIQEILIGVNNYQLVRIPRLVWYSFGVTSGKTALIANCTDIPHDPGEMVQADLTDVRIPYKWNEAGQ